MDTWLLHNPRATQKVRQAYNTKITCTNRSLHSAFYGIGRLTKAFCMGKNNGEKKFRQIEAMPYKPHTKIEFLPNFEAS